jgi:hypothetical protein
LDRQADRRRRATRHQAVARGKIDRVGLKKMAEDHLHPHGLAD